MKHISILSNLPDDMRRSIAAHAASLLPGVEISANQTNGAFCQYACTATSPRMTVEISFTAKPPDGARLVTLEELVVRGLKAVLEEICPKCGQADRGQTGEHPCPMCGLPIVHDAQQT